MYMYARRVYTKFDRRSKFFFWIINLHVLKQYAAHSHMIVKPCLLLGGFGGMLPLENLKKMMQFDIFWWVLIKS